MEKILIDAPFDDKNLCDDWLRDDVFCDSFLAMSDNGKRGKTHLIGKCEVYDEHFTKCINYWGYVEVTWWNTNNVIVIKLVGVDVGEDWEDTRNGIFEHYKKIFNKVADNEDNEDLVVRFGSENDELYVHFFFDTTKS